MWRSHFVWAGVDTGESLPGHLHGCTSCLQCDLGRLTSLVASVLDMCMSPVWSLSRVIQCCHLWGRWDYLAWYEGDRVLCWARRPSTLPPASRAGGTAEQMGIPGSFPSSFSETVSQLKLTWLSASSPFPLSPPCCFCLLAALKCHVNEQDRESFLKSIVAQKSKIFHPVKLKYLDYYSYWTFRNKNVIAARTVLAEAKDVCL